MHLISHFLRQLAAVRQWWAGRKVRQGTKDVMSGSCSQARAPTAPFVQLLHREEHISFSLEDAELCAYESSFDAERERLSLAIEAWSPAAPARKEYAELRDEICRYNARMHNGYAITCWQFEQQELKGRQEAFKARIRHDMLPGYDALASACKNLGLPARYPLLQRKARRAMAKVYPELFNHRLFKAWSVPTEPPCVPDYATLPLHSPKQLPVRYLSDFPELGTEAPRRPSLALAKPIQATELLHALLTRQRALDARKVLFAVLEDRGEAPPSLIAIRSLVVQVREMLRELEVKGSLVQGRGLLAAWDELPEPTWHAPTSAGGSDYRGNDASTPSRVLPPGDAVSPAALVSAEELVEWFGCTPMRTPEQP